MVYRNAAMTAPAKFTVHREAPLRLRCARSVLTFVESPVTLHGGRGDAAMRARPAFGTGFGAGTAMYIGAFSQLQSLWRRSVGTALISAA